MPRDEVYIVDGARTPFLKARGRRGPFSASDLAVSTGRDLLARQSFKPEQLDEVIIGCMMPSADEANIGRVIALRLGCGYQVPGWTVQRNCASGLQSIDNANQLIRLGRADLILAGGTDAMSHAPLILNEQMTNWFSDWSMAKSFGQRLKILTKLRIQAPIIALLRGLTDPIVGLNMGHTAEIIAHRFGITREQMDEFAARSHQRLAQAVDQNHLTEITPLYDNKGNFYLHDDGLRRDSTQAKLANLKPAFDKKFGLVTPGNSSQVTDGAALMILASQTAIEKHQLKPMAKIIDVQWVGLDPAQMGLGPAYAIGKLLARRQMSLNDIDYIELNEAFAGQVLACLAAWRDAEFCQKELGLTSALGDFSQDKLNIDGGAVAVGHPIGASGTRVTLHAAHVLKRQQKRYAIASLCIGGGLGGAILIENTVV